MCISQCVILEIELQRQQGHDFQVTGRKMSLKNVIKNKKEAGEVKNLRFMLKLASKK